MRRFMTLPGVALATFAVCMAFAPTTAQAQYIQVQTYSPPPVVVPSYYSAPVYANPPVTTYSVPVIQSSYYPGTISYYPSPAPVYSYSAPAPVYTYSAPVVAPAPGYYTTRTYYGLGIFRPRGYYSETTYAPVR